MEHGIEQFAEADLLLVMPFCRRMVYGKAKGFRWSKKPCQLSQAA
jgi:hypothetical protein